MTYQSKLMDLLLTQMDKSHESDPNRRKAKCTKCGTTHHTGNFRSCPLHDMTTALAKRVGREASELMAHDHTLTFEAAIVQAQAAMGNHT
jgi:hypothetical protein